MGRHILTHLRHHLRFYISALIGAGVYVLVRDLSPPVRLIAAGDSFFAVYLLAMAMLVAQITPQQLCRKAASEDEGIFLVVLIALTIIGVCCAAIISVLNARHGPVGVTLALALACAPLGWLTLHIIAAFHYANLYYAPGAEPPLQFPDTKEPGVWDFLYYSFVVGMTAQVSDVQVLSTKLRRATLGHALVSFFFNTAIIAMAVNAVIAIAS
jgi:uncharacterized membrane protein